MNFLKNIRKTQKEIRSGTYNQNPCIEFELKSRGKNRVIKAHVIDDRVVQRSLNDNSLLPAIKDKIIYTNSASLRGRGISFARNKFARDMQECYREYGDDAYVLLIDFKKYFDNILHSVALSQFSKVLSPAELTFLIGVFDKFKVDVSYMTDEEYSNCLLNLFDSLKYYHEGHPKGKRKLMMKSVGIGSHTSQLTGVFFPHDVDNYCTIVRGCKWYGRYMDDMYIMGTKDFLKSLYPDIECQLDKLGITINKNKTRLNKLTNKNKFLQIVFTITPSGRVIKKATSKTFRTEYRRLNKFKRLLDEGKIKFKDIQN